MKKHLFALKNNISVFLKLLNKQKYAKYSKYILIFLISFSFFWFITNKNDNSKVKAENYLLQSKLKMLSSKFNKLSSSIDSVNEINNQLRIAINLEPISEAEAKLGIGGSKDVYSSFNIADKDITSVISFVDQLNRKLDFQRSQYNVLFNKLNENKEMLENIPSIRPADGNFMTSSFGMRMHPILHIMKMHQGIDINLSVGSSVVATGNGIVAFAGNKNGYGNVVEIDHGFGYHSVYAHLSEILVNSGKKVKRGELIAKSGNTGLSTGPHLHYEISFNGEKINPLNFFLEDINVF